MAQASGSKGQIIYQEETTYKTDPATPDCKLLYFKTEGLRSSRDMISSDVIRGNRNPAKPITGDINVAGSISTELQAYIGTLLKAALGTSTPTGAGPYTHTIKIGSSLPSLLIEKGFTDIAQYFKLNGCKVNKMSLAIRSSGFQEISFDLIGAKETAAGTSFDSTPSNLGKQSWSGFEIATIEEGGAAIAIITEIDLAVENNLDGSVYVIGGAGIRTSLPEGIVKVSGTVKALFENLTLYNKAVNSTESKLKVNYKFGAGGGAAGAEELEILVPELIYAQNAPVIDGPKGVLVDLPFEAYYDNSTEASAIQMILKNTQATI